MYAIYSVRIPRFGLFNRSEEHFVHTECIGTVFFNNHIRIYHIEHRFTHLFNSPSTDILAVFQNKFGSFVFGSPSLESFQVEDIVGYDVDIYVDRSNFILIFQIERYESIGILDTVDKVTSSLYHSLIYKFLERLFGYGDTPIVQELIPET